MGERLADRKRPRGLVVVPELRRSPSGKADLRWAQQLACGPPRTALER